MLDKIIVYKKGETESLKRKVTIRDLRLKAADQERARDFLSCFAGTGLNVIAEIKKASPSAGVLRPDYKPADLARELEGAGAVALSVLTDGKFFLGSLAHMEAVRSVVGLPVLRKDFVLDEYHVIEARAHGADAVLLIAAVVDDSQLKDYQDVAVGLGMTALVEVHDERELARALRLRPLLLGINNRNLKTLKTDTRTSDDLIKLVPKGTVVISESGLKTHDDLARLHTAGFRGFLIGESLMKADDPAGQLRLLLTTY